MLAFDTSTSEILVALEPSDAKWLGEEMSFLAELYRSKAAIASASSANTTTWR